MKRRISWILAVAAVAAVSAPFVAGGSAAQSPRLKVRVITLTSTTAGTWDPLQFKAYSAVAKLQNWALQIAQAVPYGKADQVLERWGGEGVDIVFSTDAGFQSKVLAAAKKYPKTLWVTMSDLSTTNDLPNVAAYSVDWCQVGLVQGVAAGLLTQSGTVGVVAGLNILPTQKTVAGLRFGSTLVRPGTKVDVTVTGDVLDAVKNQEAAAALVNNGADVIVAPVNGGVSPQIAARVQELGKWYIGSYADERQYAPKSVPTSGVLDFGAGYATVGTQRTRDTFKPGIFRFGIKQGFVKLAPFLPQFKAQERRARAVIAQWTTAAKPVPKCQTIGAPK